MGGITAEEPLATSRLSYFRVRRLDNVTARLFGSTRTAATPSSSLAFSRSKYSAPWVFIPAGRTVPSRKCVSPTREYSGPFSFERTVTWHSRSTDRIASSAARPAALAPMIT